MPEYIENLKSVPKIRILGYTTQTTLWNDYFKKNDIKKFPSALQMANFRKVRKFTKNTIFIHEISQNFEWF